MNTAPDATGAPADVGTTVLTPQTEQTHAAGAEAKTETAATETDKAAGAEPTTEGAPKGGEGKEGEAKEGEGKEGDKPTGAPEEYAPFELPEGFTADGPVMDEFKAAAKALNLPQEAAQQVVNLGAKLVERTQAAMRDAWTATQTQWVDTIKKDAEIGGARLNERVAVAVKALDRFGSPELRKALEETGMGNHPEIVRAFYRVGLAISEDTLVTSDTKAAPPKDAAEVLYGSNG